MCSQFVPHEPGPAILVVEDDPAGQRLLEIVLRTMGDVTLATGESAARAALRRRRFDVVVCDLGLPALAYEFIAELVAEGYRVVVVTAHADEATLDRVEGLGIHGVVTKPFSPAQLRSVVEAALG